MGCTMFVQILKEVPGQPHKVGDVLEFPDAVGRGYIDPESGYAKEVSVADHLRSQQIAQFNELKGDVQRAITEAVKPLRAHPPAYQPVHQGEYVGTTAAERDRSKVGLGEIVRCLYWRKAHGDDERVSDSMAKYAHEKLDRVWKLSRSSWQDNSDQNVTAENPLGISRDGSESTNGAPTYGYLVRPEFAGDVFMIEPESDVFVNTKQIPVGATNEYHYPALDQYSSTTPTRTSNYFAGVVLGRKPEDVSRGLADAKISEIEFKLTDLTGMTKISRDLLADSFVPIDGFVTELFRRAYKWRRDWDFINGTGAGEPLGILQAGCLVKVTRDTASHIVYEDISGMMAKLHPSCWAGAYWIANLTTITDLMAIKNHATNYVYQPNSLVGQWMTPSLVRQGGPGVGFGAAFQGTLEGLPVKFTEKVPALGTSGDLCLVHNPSYGEATRQSLEIGMSEHRYFETDQVAIRFKLRNDGKPMWKSYFTGADGNTYSPFIGIS